MVATRVRALTIELVQGGHARETLTVRQLRPTPTGTLGAVLDGVHRLVGGAPDGLRGLARPGHVPADARPEAGPQHELVTADAGPHVARAHPGTEPVAELA